MAWWIPLAMAGGSMLQEGSKNKAQAQQNLMEAEKTRYSPWTGIQGNYQTTNPNYLGAGLHGAMSGYMLDKSMNPGKAAPLQPQAPQVPQTPNFWSQQASRFSAPAGHSNIYANPGMVGI